MRALLAAALVGIVACHDDTADVMPVVGIWEMDTSRSRYLANETRDSELLRCSAAKKRVRCAIVSERRNGMLYNGAFEAEVDGPRAFVKGLDAQEVQLSFKDRPVLDMTFYDRNRAAYSWRARRSGNGDTLVVTRIDITPDGPESSEARYNRVRQAPPYP